MSARPTLYSNQMEAVGDLIELQVEVAGGPHHNMLEV